MSVLPNSIPCEEIKLGDKVNFKRTLSKKEKFKLWLITHFARFMRVPINIDDNWFNTQATITAISNSTLCTIDYDPDEKTLEKLKIEKQKPQHGFQRVSIALYWDNAIKRYSTFWSARFAGVNPTITIAINLPILHEEFPGSEFYFANLEPDWEMVKLIKENLSSV